MNKATPLAKEWYRMLFGVQRSVRYHSRREMFFQRFGKTTTFLAAIGGVGAFSSLLAATDRNWIPLVFAAITGVFSTLDLVIGSNDAAKLHNDLGKEFTRLEREMVLKRDSFSESDIQDFSAKRLDIELKEPPVLRVLNTICHNELCRALGHEASQMVKIGNFQKWFSPFFDFREGSLKKGYPTPSLNG